MTLDQANEGQWLIVKGTGTDEVTLQALRFGIEEGAEVFVERKISGGPVIIARNHLEIAVGRRIAAAIEVEPVREPGK